MRRNNIRIAFCNTNGLTKKTEEFKAYLSEEKIDMVVINETHLQPSTTTAVPNYNFYRNYTLNT